MKKLLSVVLAAATVASVGVTAFAADYELNGVLVYDDSHNNVYANGNDTVTPDQKVYVSLAEVGADIANQMTATLGGDPDVPGSLLQDEDFFKFKYKKGSDNSKMITGIKLVEKDIGEAGGRHEYIEIALADDWTDTSTRSTPPSPSPRRMTFI